MSNNNIPIDRQEQYDKIRGLVLPGEDIHAVYDAKGVGTGFIGITSKRVILQDNSFVGGKSAVVSIPFSEIHYVAFYGNKSIMGQFASESNIAINVSGHTHTVEFRGDEKARHAHDLILQHIL